MSWSGTQLSCKHSETCVSWPSAAIITTLEREAIIPWETTVGQSPQILLKDVQCVESHHGTVVWGGKVRLTDTVYVVLDICVSYVSPRLLLLVLYISKMLCIIETVLTLVLHIIMRRYVSSSVLILVIHISTSYVSSKLSSSWSYRSRVLHS